MPLQRIALLLYLFVQLAGQNSNTTKLKSPLPFYEIHIPFQVFIVYTIIRKVKSKTE